MPCSQPFIRKQTIIHLSLEMGQAFGIILGGGWCDIVLNVHAPAEDRSDNTKDSLLKEVEGVFYELP